MGKIVLLAVAAAWAAVLLPPLLRSRLENRPGSSVTDFRRQLSHAGAHRAHPDDGADARRWPVRSPRRRCSGRPSPGATGSMQRAHLTVAAAPGASTPASSHRRTPREAGTRAHHGHRQVQVQRISRREQVRRRRTNVLFVLVAANVLTLFLAATTKSRSMVYAFAPGVRVAVRVLLQAGADPSVRAGPPATATRLVQRRLTASIDPGGRSDRHRYTAVALRGCSSVGRAQQSHC